MNSLLLFVFAFACSEKKLGPDDVEYRKDENGSQILYEIGAKEPFGTGKEAFVVGKHPNGKKHFEISFLNGLKDGPFNFWQKTNFLLSAVPLRRAKEMVYLSLTEK